MVKELIKTNILSIAALIVIILIFAFTNALVISAGLMFLWFIYVIWANWTLIVPKPEDTRRSIRKAVKESQYRYFSRQCGTIQAAYDSVAGRVDSLDDLGAIPEIERAVEVIRRQLDNNISSTVLFISTYDYINKPEPKQLEKITAQCRELVEKFNALIDVLIENERSTGSVDLSSVDDILESLKEVSKM